MRLLIEMDVAEAQLALGVISDRVLESSRLAAISDGEEHEIFDLTSKLLGKVATRLTDALYPDTCRWMDNEDCPEPIERDGLCARHNRHKARIAEIMA